MSVQFRSYYHLKMLRGLGRNFHSTRKSKKPNLGRVKILSYQKQDFLLKLFQQINMKQCCIKEWNLNISLLCVWWFISRLIPITFPHFTNQNCLPVGKLKLKTTFNLFIYWVFENSYLNQKDIRAHSRK